MTILKSLETILGADCLITEPLAMAGYLSEPRKRFHTNAIGVALPRSVSHVQKIVLWANANSIAIVPQGGNTGMVGGQVPVLGTELIVSLSRLNQLHGIDPSAKNMTVDAGMTLQRAQDIAEENNLLFPLSIGSQGTAQIGGILSSNAGGVQVLAYGNARQLCMGIEAVLPDGSLFNGLNALKKNNTGYDISNLLIGAEGTLGLITGATLKLFPRPKSHEIAWINVASPDAALKLFSLLQHRLGNTLTAFELMPRFGIDIQLQHKIIEKDPSASFSPWYVLAEVSHFHQADPNSLCEALEEAFESDLVADASLAHSLSARQHMWTTREQMSASQSREGASIKHDISVPVSSVPELIERGCIAAQNVVPGIRPCPFGHLGDGNIHFNFSQPVGADPKVFMAGAEPVHAAIYEIVADLGGSISAEHGIGQLKVDLLAKSKDPVALKTMRAIKQALDPNNISNPGKILKHI